MAVTRLGIPEVGLDITVVSGSHTVERAMRSGYTHLAHDLYSWKDEVSEQAKRGSFITLVMHMKNCHMNKEKITTMIDTKVKELRVSPSLILLDPDMEGRRRIKEIWKLFRETVMRMYPLCFVGFTVGESMDKATKNIIKRRRSSPDSMMVDGMMLDDKFMKLCRERSIAVLSRIRGNTRRAHIKLIMQAQNVAVIIVDDDNIDNIIRKRYTTIPSMVLPRISNEIFSC